MIRTSDAQVLTGGGRINRKVRIPMFRKWPPQVNGDMGGDGDTVRTDEYSDPHLATRVGRTNAFDEALSKARDAGSIGDRAAAVLCGLQLLDATSQSAVYWLDSVKADFADGAPELVNSLELARSDWQSVRDLVADLSGMSADVTLELAGRSRD